MGRGSPRREIGIRGARRRRLDHPWRGNELLTLPRAVMREQAAKPRIVAQHRVEAEMRQLETLGIQQPFRIVLGADRAPYLLMQIVGHRLAGGVAQYDAEHVGLNAGVVESRSR